MKLSTDTINIRGLSPYEIEKWYGEYGYFEFEADEGGRFLMYGDELGEAFDAAASCTNKSSYGLSDEFERAAQIQVLDMYYDQIFVYADQYGGYENPESLGLPPLELFKEKMNEFSVIDQVIDFSNHTDESRKLWDWAMEWRDEHFEEYQERRRVEYLERELARVKK